MTDKNDVSMPTRDEISALCQRFDNALPRVAPQQREIFSETIIMLRRIADALDGCVMVPKSVWESLYVNKDVGDCFGHTHSTFIAAANGGNGNG